MRRYADAWIRSSNPIQLVCFEVKAGSERGSNRGSTACAWPVQRPILVLAAASTRAWLAIQAGYQAARPHNAIDQFLQPDVTAAEKTGWGIASVMMPPAVDRGRAPDLDATAKSVSDASSPPVDRPGGKKVSPSHACLEPGPGSTRSNCGGTSLSIPSPRFFSRGDIRLEELVNGIIAVGPLEYPA